MNAIKHLVSTVGFLALAAVLSNSLPGCASEKAPEPKTEMNAHNCALDSKPTGLATAPAEHAPEPAEAPAAVTPEVDWDKAIDAESPLFKPQTERDAVAAQTPLFEVETKPETPAQSRLSVVESTACLEVADRIPMGIASRFTLESGAVMAFVKVKNPGPATHIHMIWKRDSQVRAKMRLTVGTSPRWRTWSKLQLRSWDTGDWSVEIRDADDLLLDTLQFEVNAADDSES